MPGSIGGVLRLTAISVIAAAVVACSPVERPGPSAALPPPMSAPQADTSGAGASGMAAADASSAAGTTSVTSDAVPAKIAPVRISFAPITGTPGQMRYAMEDDLKKWAVTRSFVVVATDDPTAVYRLKGRITAVGDNSGGLLVYVWDVYDASGKRLHRFSGQQVAGSTEADPWVGITLDNIDTAARETIDGLADWLRG